MNEELLKKARAAGARLADAEREVESARAGYHGIIRRMHLAGSSLREIAQALDLSHQRVQQMVDGAGGSWWRRMWRPRRLKGNLICTFCKRPHTEIARLIAGPRVYICDACIEAAERDLAGTRPAGLFAPTGERSRARCSFCSKTRSENRPLLTSPSGNLCGECLDVCRQILIDSAAGTQM